MAAVEMMTVVGVMTMVVVATTTADNLQGIAA